MKLIILLLTTLNIALISIHNTLRYYTIGSCKKSTFNAEQVKKIPQHYYHIICTPKQVVQPYLVTQKALRIPDDLERKR